MNVIESPNNLNIYNDCVLSDSGNRKTTRDLYRFLIPLASRDVADIDHYFKRNSIDRKQRYKIACLFAKDDPRFTSANLKVFRLKSEGRSKIYNLVFRRELEVALEFLPNYRLSKDLRLAIGIKASSLDGRMTVQYAHNFKLDGEKLFLILQGAFIQSPSFAGKAFIHSDTRVKLNEEQRCKLLKIYLKENADKAHEAVKQFEITSRDLLFDLALLTARLDGWAFSAKVKEWNFDEQDKRFALAKAALKNDPAGVLKFLSNYELNDIQSLEIFRLAIKEGAQNVQDCLSQWGLNPSEKYSLAALQAVLSPQSFLKDLSNWKLAEPEKEFLTAFAKSIISFQ